ncbi:RNase III inhibitor [Marinomonas spartinae]|uniref:type II toxin-antitoxin system antitoxin DNA ADP-ribosyl glycohydrolase DarG n=1 Tax=Marinomonas spartinae TaxID=1792290 RepID=UPI0008090BA9|nr:macro domain-containing protein [Marinomonas spartinae]SBS34608.1 RNase III inhibitor [Marinomonas spartinae]
MIHYTQGNLLEADVEALVNTVNTVGVMGKGIALMFKERFPQNTQDYSKACKAKQVETGRMFVTQTDELVGPKWIVNFPTKRHWRNPSKLEWITEGLFDLKQFILDKRLNSIAIPALGAGNGKLNWESVKPEIERILGDLESVDILVFEPTQHYQNVAKQKGHTKLTPARAMIAELIRQYWVMGMECTLLEVQKLAWFLERSIEKRNGSNKADNPLDLRFEANLYGPYADRLRHLIDHLDGTYLHCNKRINDAEPLDVIWFEDSKQSQLNEYLNSAEMQPYRPSLQDTIQLIDGFETPYGMELLSTIDWLISKENIEPDLQKIIQGIQHWPAGETSAKRKTNLFDERSINIALTRLKSAYQAPHQST